MKTPFLILASILLLSFSNCSPDDGDSPLKLPPITTTGENTFGCYIDGKLLIPRDGTGTFNIPDRGMRFITGGIPPDVAYYELKVNDYAGDKTASLTIHFQDLYIVGAGQHIIDYSNCEDNVDSPLTTNMYCRIFDEVEGLYKSYCSFPNSGNINITKLNDSIIAGTFSGRLREFNNPSNEISIAEGRFDINKSSLIYKTFN